MFAAALLASLLASSPAVSTGVEVPHNVRITLDVHEADIEAVVRLLAEKGRLNVVLADEVKGKVTVRLRNVRVEEALSMVLRLKGLGAEQLGNIIRVAPLEQLRREAEQRLALSEASQDERPLKTVFIPVNYARAEELLPLVKATLSRRGKASVDARTNTIIVTDVE